MVDECFFFLCGVPIFVWVHDVAAVVKWLGAYFYFLWVPIIPIFWHGRKLLVCCWLGDLIFSHSHFGFDRLANLQLEVHNWFGFLLIISRGPTPLLVFEMKRLGLGPKAQEPLVVAMYSEGGDLGIIERCKRTKSNSSPDSCHRHTDDGWGQPLFRYLWSVQSCASSVVLLKVCSCVFFLQ